MATQRRGGGAGAAGRAGSTPLGRAESTAGGRAGGSVQYPGGQQSGGQSGGQYGQMYGSGPTHVGQSQFVPSSQHRGLGGMQQAAQMQSVVPQSAHRAPVSRDPQTQQPPQPQQPAWFETTSYSHRGYSEVDMSRQIQQQQHGQYDGYPQRQGLGGQGGHHMEGFNDSYGDRNRVASSMGTMGTMGTMEMVSNAENVGYTQSASQSYDTYTGAQNSSGYSLKGNGGQDDDDDLPLLEELGIDMPAILHRIKAILTFRYSTADAMSLDLGGPIIFMSIFAVCHLLVGKLHFGYILGWMVMGSVLLWFILSSMAAGGSEDGYDRYSDGQGDDSNRLDLYSCCSIVGYSLLPLVVHAGLSLLFPRRSMATYVVAVVAVGWATAAASQLFMMRGKEGLKGKKMVVAYPCALMYSAFALLTLY